MNRNAKKGSGILSGRGGFTLVEVLLAFLVLMLGIIAVLSLFPVGMKLSKEMVETSTAALVAKNARGCMEATELADKIAGAPMNFGFPRPGTSSNFPCYFPDDMSAATPTFLGALTNLTVVPNIVASINSFGQVVDTANRLYSWDARFDVGRGAIRTPWGWTEDEAQQWFGKYFRYYVVDISVYRNYEEVSLSGGGSIANVGGPTPTDANLVPVCQLTLNADPPVNLQVGWYIRVPNDHSDWYRIQKLNGRVLTLDRPYVHGTGSKGNIIATGSLVGHFTTFLAAHYNLQNGTYSE